MLQRTFIFAFLCIALSGCVSRQLGYFEVAPFARIPADKIDQPLYVKISSRVEDHFTMKNFGIEFKVSSFHMSLMHACKKVFSDVFSETRIYMEGDNGFRLEIQQFEPAWVYEKEFPTDSLDEFYCRVSYGCSLYRDETFISQSTGSVRLKYLDADTFNTEMLFKETVKKAIGKMAEELYK